VDRVAPLLSSLTMTRRRFAVGRAATALRAVARASVPSGTVFAYTLSEPAQVSIAIYRTLPGRRAGRRCLPATASRRRLRPCARTLRRGTLVRSAARGRRSTPFSGRIGSSALAPGQYRATVTATDANGNVSRPASVAFTTVRP
jgi:hypothetical protein